MRWADIQKQLLDSRPALTRENSLFTVLGSFVNAVKVTGFAYPNSTAIWADITPGKRESFPRTAASPKQKFHQRRVVGIQRMFFKALNNQIPLLQGECFVVIVS